MVKTCGEQPRQSSLAMPTNMHLRMQLTETGVAQLKLDSLQIELWQDGISQEPYRW